MHEANETIASNYSLQLNKIATLRPLIVGGLIKIGGWQFSQKK